MTMTTTTVFHVIAISKCREFNRKREKENVIVTSLNVRMVTLWRKEHPTNCELKTFVYDLC